jgi:hypothetical protein
VNASARGYDYVRTLKCGCCGCLSANTSVSVIASESGLRNWHSAAMANENLSACDDAEERASCCR